MVWEGDAALMGRTRHYRGARGLEEHVGRMDVLKVKLGWLTRTLHRWCRSWQGSKKEV